MLPQDKLDLQEAAHALNQGRTHKPIAITEFAEKDVPILLGQAIKAFSKREQIAAVSFNKVCQLNTCSSGTGSLDKANGDYGRTDSDNVPIALPREIANLARLLVVGLGLPQLLGRKLDFVLVD